MFAKNKMYYSNANLSQLPRPQSCNAFDSESNNGIRFGINRYQSLNSFDTHQSKIGLFILEKIFF
jgi:hypothetical protein